MSEQERPRIEFPCEYPVTVVADAGVTLREQLFAVTQRASRNGNYQSLVFVITATGEVQLRRLFEGLKACPGVHVVL